MTPPLTTPLSLAQELIQQGLGSQTHLPHDELCAEIAGRLSYVSIHRLSPFWMPFLQKSRPNPSSFVGGVFLPGSTWEMIWNSYVFDRKLRGVLMDAISRIEVALRTQIAYHWSAASKNAYAHLNMSTYKSAFRIASKNGDFSPRTKLWFTIENNFLRNKDVQGEVYEEVRHAKGLQDLTIGAFMEFTTLGNLETLLRAGLKHKIVKAVAKAMGFGDVPFFVSCISLLKDVRNACAHQTRVWNRYWRTKQSLAVLCNVSPDFSALVQEDRIGAALTICQIFLRTIAPNSLWKGRLLELLRIGYIPVMEIHRVLGFSTYLWYKNPLWASATDGDLCGIAPH